MSSKDRSPDLYVSGASLLVTGPGTQIFVELINELTKNGMIYRVLLRREEGKVSSKLKEQQE